MGPCFEPSQRGTPDFEHMLTVSAQDKDSSALLAAATVVRGGEIKVLCPVHPAVGWLVI